MLYFIIVIVSTFGGGFMISLEEAAKDTTLDSKIKFAIKNFN